MTPGKYNMICPQGATFSKQLTYAIDGVTVDLTTYTARMQVREKHTSPNIVVLLNTENNGIEIDDDGKINLYISATDAELIKPKDYFYDLEIISPSGTVTRLIEGKFIVTPEVTR